jgi:hypothetical protein
VALQVRGRRDQHHRQPRHAARDQARVGDHAAAHADVEALGHQIDRPVVEADFDLELRVALGQHCGQRQHEAAAEADAHGDAHAPADAAARARDGTDGVVQAAQRVARALGEARPLGGQRQPPRGAIEQAHADLRLQLDHVLAHRCRRQVQPLRGGGEAAAGGGLDEGDQALQVFHRAQPGVENVVPFYGWRSKAARPTVKPSTTLLQGAFA